MASAHRTFSLLLLLPGLVLPSVAQAAREVSQSRECAACHIMWLPDFKRKDVEALIPYEPKPVVASGRQDVSSTERMCFSCHDGFVLDSRMVWKAGGHGHPVGVKPSEKVQLPMKDGKILFPLNEDGKIYCGTCHSAHGVSWAQKESPIFLRAPNIDSSFCLACHLNRSTGPEEGNHPVFRHMETYPERLREAGGKFGRKDEVICQSCHTPHGAQGIPLLLVDNRQAELCVSCHRDKEQLPGSRHDLTGIRGEVLNAKGQKVAEYGPCSGCHILHEAKEGAPLWGRITPTGEDPVRSLCMECHRETGIARRKLIKDHSHPTNVSIEPLPLVVGEEGWSSHHPLADLRPLRPMPLFDAAGRKGGEGADRVTCLTCHDPHVWRAGGSPSVARVPSQPRSTGDRSPNRWGEEGDGQSSFLRIGQGRESNLCINCHIDKRGVIFSKHNLDVMGGELRDELEHISPAIPHRDQGACGACHHAHNGNGPRMAAWSRRAGEGASESLCRDCHRRGGVAEKRQVGRHSHPLLVRADEVGDGVTRLPLFDMEGHRRELEGVVDCTTCHDPHQWDPLAPASVAGGDPKVDGDATNSFLRLPAAPSPMLCAECHDDRALVVRTDHDMRVTAPDAVNRRGQGVSSSGVCGQCHAVHNAFFDVALWGRIPGEALDRQESLCRSCHQEAGVAAAKIPAEAYHPRKVIVWSNLARDPLVPGMTLPDVPVFNLQGEAGVAGVITCSSCHDPHRWNPRLEAPGGGRNEEGDVMSSFLRNASSAGMVCADCHGADGLYRYKYFHGRQSRQPHPLYRVIPLELEEEEKHR